MNSPSLHELNKGTSELRHMAQRRQGHFPGYLTAQEASRLGLRIRLGAPMTPLDVVVYLGYKVQRHNNKDGRSPVPSFLRKVETAVLEWLPALGLVLHEEWGKTHAKATDKTQRYVDFRVPSEGPAPFTPRQGSECRVWRDPSLATWSAADAERQRQQRVAAREAAWDRHHGRRGAA